MQAQRAKFIAAMVLLVSLIGPVMAQNTPPVSVTAAPPHPARELTVSKCFQCHSEAMWRDQRQDARAWEAALYRMVARGAIWTGEDIKIMAGFLAADFGLNSPKSVPTTR
jgi:hypothetical protein